MQVPKDAWMMDMVFSDTGDAHGGFYDSNNGLDYHVPVVGGTASPSPLRVVHVSVEMAPIAKVLPAPWIDVTCLPGTVARHAIFLTCRKTRLDFFCSYIQWYHGRVGGSRCCAFWLAERHCSKP